MKKKALFFLMLVAAGGSVCFADGLELGATMLVLPREGETFLGGGLNMATSLPLTKTIGLGLFFDASYIPVNGVSVFLLDMLVGPTYKIIDNGKFSLPVSAGVFGVQGMAAGPGGAVEGFNIGAGANITATVKFTQKMSFYVRLQGGYGFLDSGGLFITPSIGIIL
jgi:hypothetical protein